jgi:hypothetical protein
VTLPYANLFAAYDRDRSALEILARDLGDSAEFAEVCQPIAGWVLAVAPLPGTTPDGDKARSQGLVFAEGRDGVRHALGGHARADADLGERFLARPESLAQLPGDFGFLQLLPDGDALVVRSATGLVPFYVCVTRERVAIGTRLGDFARFFGQARIDPLVNACWASGELVFPDRRTFLRDVSIVPGGCFARLQRGSLGVGRYWDPRPARLAEPKPGEHAERLRAILIEQLARGLDPEGGNLLLLSGGVDSSSVAAVARRALDKPLMTLSFLPEQGHPARPRELEFIDNLKFELGFARSWEFPFSRGRYLELIRRTPPVVFYLLHPALGVIPDVAREAPIHTVCGGEFADEVCGSSLVMADFAYHTRFRQLLARTSVLPSGSKDLGRWLKHRALRRLGRPRWPPRDTLPQPIDARVREEYAEWFLRERRRALADPRPHPTLAAYVAVSGWNVMNWEGLSPLGIRRVYPFFNRAALELAFECHPLELFGPGMKTLLRRAVSDIVPPANLLRQDKGRWGHRVRETVVGPRMIPAELAPIVRRDWVTRPPKQLDWNDLKVIENLVLFSKRLSQRCAGRPLDHSSADLTLEFR